MKVKNVPSMHLSIQRRVRYMASSILGPVIVVLTTSSRAIIISAPILFYINNNHKNKLGYQIYKQEEASLAPSF